MYYASLTICYRTVYAHWLRANKNSIGTKANTVSRPSLQISSSLHWNILCNLSNMKKSNQTQTKACNDVSADLFVACSISFSLYILSSADYDVAWLNTPYSVCILESTNLQMRRRLHDRSKAALNVLCGCYIFYCLCVSFLIRVSHVTNSIAGIPMFNALFGRRHRRVRGSRGSPSKGWEVSVSVVIG